MPRECVVLLQQRRNDRLFRLNSFEIEDKTLKKNPSLKWVARLCERGGVAPPPPPGGAVDRVRGKHGARTQIAARNTPQSDEIYREVGSRRQMGLCALRLYVVKERPELD